MKERTEINDHTLLAEEVYRIIEEDRNRYSVYSLEQGSVPEELCYGKKPSRGDYVVLGEDTALELGSPDTLSAASVLVTAGEGLVSNRAWIIGNSLAEAEEKKLSFMQMIIVNGETDEISSSALNRVKNLANKIPGYMTRALPGKLWARIHRDLLEKGFDLHMLAQALHRSCLESSPGIRNADVILISGDNESVEKYMKLCDAARAISSENRKQRWLDDGVLSCDDLDCSTCDEQENCNTIREIIINRRRRDNE